MCQSLGMIGRVMTSRDGPVLILRSLWICYLTKQKGLCRCDSVQNLEMEMLPWIIGGWRNVIICLLKIRDCLPVDFRVRGRCGFEDGGRGHQPWNKAGKNRNEHSMDTLILAQWDLCLASNLQNCDFFLNVFIYFGRERQTERDREHVIGVER